MLFETGYGPSGLPHIGTFGEVARTTMVRHAFRVLTEDKIKTRLIAFSDDMDGLRKVPDNVPNKEMLAEHLGKPLTRVPDPFGTHTELRRAQQCAAARVLDTFGFDYEFAVATDYYTAGRFDATLLQVLERYDEVMEIMLPTLREERARPIRRSCRSAAHRHRAAGADRSRATSPAGTITYERSRHGERSRRRSPAAAASCNGSPTGRCAGSRSASTTRWPART